MAWSRIESKFWQHPKFAGWKPAEKWALGELIGYCCEYRTEGLIPDDIALLPRSTTTKLLSKAIDSGWIDVDEDGTKHIHDWHVYHPKDPTASDRVLRMRRKQQRKQSVTDTVNVTPPTNTSTNTGKSTTPNKEPLLPSNESREGEEGNENGVTPAFDLDAALAGTLKDMP